MHVFLAAADHSALWNIAAQTAGFIGTVLGFVMYLARKRKTILLGKFTCDILWILHYGLIGAYSGAALNVLALGRESVFYNKEKKWASSKFWLVLFVALTIISSSLSWEGMLSLLPMIGSCCAVMSFWCTNPFHIRLLALPCQILWLIYNILHQSLPSTLSCSISLVAIFIGLIGDIKNKKETNNKE